MEKTGTEVQTGVHTGVSGLNGATPRYSCRLYGVTLKSAWPLPPAGRGMVEEPLAEVEIVAGADSLFHQGRGQATPPADAASWCRVAHLADDSTYLCWEELFEFLIQTDGRRIWGRPLSEEGREAFRAYLLGQVLSFALVNQGIEPLHCTVVVGEAGAVGILGDCGYGKSSLAAAFLRAGYRLLTDDLLVLREQGGDFWAYPGPPRLKLFPEAARLVLGDEVRGIPLSPWTPKQAIALTQERFSSSAAPIKALLVLRPPIPGKPVKRIKLRKMNLRQAFLALTENTFNTRTTTPERLKRLFALPARLANAVPVYSLSYPRDLARLPEVAAAVVARLSRSDSQISKGC